MGKEEDEEQPPVLNKSKSSDSEDQPGSSKSNAEDEPDNEECQNEEKPPPIAPVQYEYLDHTADVQLHAWGDGLEEALQQLVISLYGYMTTEISRVEPVYTMDFEASGHDLQALVYNLLDTCLYNFCAEPFFIGCAAQVLKLERPSISLSASISNEEGIEEREFQVHLRVWGESFDPEKHPPGTEVKAITYSNMQIMEPKGDGKAGESKTDIFVIIDI